MEVRSVLTQYAGEGEPLPRPVRRRGGEENGVQDVERKGGGRFRRMTSCFGACVFLQLLPAADLERARHLRDEVAFAIEQPASPL